MAAGQSRAFPFHIADLRCWATGHAFDLPSITVTQRVGAITCDTRLTPAEARAMAVALEAAATFAETVIPDTGLGESEAG